MLDSAIATVMVSDFERSVRFYKDTLGLDEKVRHGDFWAEYATPDGFVIALHPAREDTPFPPKGGVSIGFGVGDADATRADLESRGVTFHGPSVVSPPVKLAFFVDPDGYSLYLSQSIPYEPG